MLDLISIDRAGSSAYDCQAVHADQMTSVLCGDQDYPRHPRLEGRTARPLKMTNGSQHHPDQPSRGPDPKLDEAASRGSSSREASEIFTRPDTGIVIKKIR